MTAEDRVVVNAEAGQNELSSFESVAFLQDESNLNLKEKSRFKRKRERERWTRGSTRGKDPFRTGREMLPMMNELYFSWLHNNYNFVSATFPEFFFYSNLFLYVYISGLFSISSQVGS